MGIIVEDGTGVADANALCSVAFADAYFTDRAIVAWTGSQSTKESALIRATDYIETRYGKRFIGDKADEDQALSWPRWYADPAAENEVPISIKKACAEYALRALTTILAPDPTTDASGRPVTSTREVVGPIETETKFAFNANVVLLKPYPAADMLLKGWLTQFAGVYR